MCLAIYKPKNQAFPKKGIIKNAWNNNPHGAGLAILKENGKVQIIKGLMTLKALNERLKSLEVKHLDVVIHFRWSTSGPKNNPAELTHPFPVSLKNEDFRKLESECDKAIIHNGVLFKPMTESFSDTAIFSRYLALKPYASNEEIGDFIGNDRLAIVSIDGVKLIGNWTNVNGLHYSNTYSIVEVETKKYDKYDYAFSDYSRDSEWSLSSFEKCPCCYSSNTEEIGMLTRIVECLDCGTAFNDNGYIDAKNYLREA